MPTSHSYDVTLQWTGDLGQGTSSYRAYGRGHEVRSAAKPPFYGSSDPAFRGDPQRWNPEELLVTALSQCHMLWYLHLAALRGVVVVGYDDNAKGLMIENDDGSGQFANVTLHPVVVVAHQTMVASAMALHDEVGDNCFVARSVNFPVRHVASVSVVDQRC